MVLDMGKFKHRPCQMLHLINQNVIFLISCSWQAKEMNKETKEICLRKEGNVLFNDALNTFFIYG